MIRVTRSFLPPLEDYLRYVREIWDRNHLTNDGPLLKELERSIENFIGARSLSLVTNGTLALQLGIRALELKGKVLTTPFSYVASTSSLVWENCQPQFVDIDSRRWTLDPAALEDAIDDETTGILATHVYGIPCHVEELETIARKHNLKIIYDAAHAFGVKFRGKPIVQYGEISTLSFHATKLFHTVEGGGIFCKTDVLHQKVRSFRNFGHRGYDDFDGLGINAKMSEIHAAMGLCNLPHVEKIISERKTLFDSYKYEIEEMSLPLQFPEIPQGTEYNYAYFPVLLPRATDTLPLKSHLEAKGIFPRRYFFPTLDKLPYVQTLKHCKNAEEISSRVLCLPLFNGMTENDLSTVLKALSEFFKK